MNTTDSLILIFAIAGIAFIIGLSFGKSAWYKIYNFQLETEHTLLSIEHDRLLLDFEDTANELLKMKGHQPSRFKRERKI